MGGEGGLWVLGNGHEATIVWIFVYGKDWGFPIVVAWLKFLSNSPAEVRTVW